MVQSERSDEISFATRKFYHYLNELHQVCYANQPPGTSHIHHQSHLSNAVISFLTIFRSSRFSSGHGLYYCCCYRVLLRLPWKHYEMPSTEIFDFYFDVLMVKYYVQLAMMTTPVILYIYETLCCYHVYWRLVTMGNTLQDTFVGRLLTGLGEPTWWQCTPLPISRKKDMVNEWMNRSFFYYHIVLWRSGLFFSY